MVSLVLIKGVIFRERERKSVREREIGRDKEEEEEEEEERKRRRIKKRRERGGGRERERKACFCKHSFCALCCNSEAIGEKSTKVNWTLLVSWSSALEICGKAVR